MATLKFESDIVINGTISKVGGTSSQFLKANGSIDSNSYLLSTYIPNWTTIINKPTTIGGYGITDVTAQGLTGFSVVTASSILSTDTILGAFNKTQAQINTKEPSLALGTSLQFYRGDKTWQTLNTTIVPEGTSLYYTNSRSIGSLLTGYTSGSGTLSSADTILSALQKLNGNILLKQDIITNPITGIGTVNTVPKFTGTGALGNSLITDDGTLVQVNGDLRATRLNTSNQYTEIGGSTGATTFIRLVSANNNQKQSTIDAIVLPGVATNASNALWFRNGLLGSEVTRMTMDYLGNFGIGVSPTERLDVGGNIKSSGTITGNQILVGSGAFFSNSYFRVGQSVNAHIQANIQNTNSGTLASSDWVATANNGTDTTNFINMGINSSGNVDSAWTIGGALDSYLFNNGGHLLIGATSVNKDIKFFSGGTLAGNEKARMFGATGNFSFGNTTDSGHKVDITGTLRVTKFDASATENWVSNVINTTSNNLSTSGILIGVGDSASLKGGILFKRTGNFGTGDLYFLNGSNANGTGITTTTDTKLLLKSNGNFIVGSTLVDNGYKFDVVGTTRFQGLSTIKGTTSSDAPTFGPNLVTTGTVDASWTGTDFATGYTHVVGSVTPITTTTAPIADRIYQLTWTVTNRTTGSFTINWGGETRSTLSTSGSLALRSANTNTLTITPTSDFNGTIVMSITLVTAYTHLIEILNSSNSSLYEQRVNGTTNVFLGMHNGRYNTTGASNSFLGNRTGAFNTSGSNNTFVGYQSGYLNTIGSSNSFLGTQSGFSLTAGTNNTFLGYQAGFTSSSAASNTFVGHKAGNLNTTGSNNTFIGHDAGISNTIGVNNVFIGLQAGRFIGDGVTPNLNSTNSTLIGFGTKPLLDGQTNQIVIGINAIGLGTNTNVIGNSGTTHGRWWGNLLLGTSTNSTYILDAVGTVRISGATTLSGLAGTGSRFVRADASGVLSAPANPTTLSGYGITDSSGINISVSDIFNITIPNNYGFFASSTTTPANSPSASVDFVQGIVFPKANNSAFQQVLASTAGDLYFGAESNSVWSAWKKILDSGNFNTYAPTLTGTGATGTWGINIGGKVDVISNSSIILLSGVRTDATQLSTFSYDGFAGFTSSSKITAPSFIGTLTGAVIGNSSTATNVAWTGITSKPTTLSGYGITDALLSSDYTASDVLTKIKTVDGTGSGLDADLLDGLDSTAFTLKSTSAGHTYNYSSTYTVPTNMVESWFKVYSGGGALSIVYLDVTGNYDNSSSWDQAVVTLAAFGMRHHITSTTSNYNGGRLLELRTTEVGSNVEIWARFSASVAAGTITIKSSAIIPTLVPATPVFSGTGALGLIYGTNRTANSMLITRGIEISGNSVLHAGNFSSTLSDIKINGSQSLGVLSTLARADHVHPIDTSRQAALSGTGFVKISGTTISYDNNSYPTLGSSFFIGTTSIANNRASASQTLTGISIDGSATTLQTPRNINGVAFNGSANITIADATKVPLTGATYIQSTGLSGGWGGTNGVNTGAFNSLSPTNNGSANWLLSSTTAGVFKYGIQGLDTGGHLRFYEGANNFVFSNNTISASTFSGALSGNATSATNIVNTGTVTLASATESNAITITQPSYANNQPVKLLNFNWYGDTWSIGNIRSASTPSNGLGIFLNGAEQVRFSTGNVTATTFTGAFSGSGAGLTGTASGLVSGRSVLVDRVGSTANANTMFSDTANGTMGWQDAYNPTNGASTLWGNYLNMRHENAGANYGTQLFISWEGADIMKYRSVYGNTFTSWKTVLDSNNFSNYASPLNGGTGYIQNQNGSAQSANMWISGTIGWGGMSDSMIFKSPTNGTNFIGGTGSVNDLTIHNGLGQGVIEIPTGTQNTFFRGTATFASTVSAPSFIGNIRRNTHSSGYMIGSYNSVGPNAANTNPIYTIGSNYTPTDTSLVNMYGIGFSDHTFWGTGKSDGWGLYTTDAGTVTNTISWGGIWTRGSIKANANITTAGTVYASGSGGFACTSYVPNGRSPIYYLGDASVYGLSYFQGTAGVTSGVDCIGFHFGTATAAGSKFTMSQDGTFRSLGDVIAYASSDRRLKDNIIRIENPLYKIKQIGGYTFDWNDKQNVHSGNDVGIVADEIEKILPQIVSTRENGYKAVKYDKLVALLIEGIKEQQLIIESQSEKINKILNHLNIN